MFQGHLKLNRSALISGVHLRLMITYLFDAPSPAVPDWVNRTLIIHCLKQKPRAVSAPSSPLPSVELDAFS